MHQDWNTLKKAANGDYSFEYKQIFESRTEFLREEGVLDGFNKASYDRSFLSVNNSLNLVRKLDKLFTNVTKHKKHKKSSLRELYMKNLGEKFIHTNHSENGE